VPSDDRQGFWPDRIRVSSRSTRCAENGQSSVANWLELSPASGSASLKHPVRRIRLVGAGALREALAVLSIGRRACGVEHSRALAHAIDRSVSKGSTRSPLGRDLADSTFRARGRLEHDEVAFTAC